jgi:antirestriction protein ArdC
MKGTEAMELVVTKLVEQIEAGAGEWKMPWQAGFTGMPRNAETKVAYRGGNVIACWLEAEAKGYSDQTWATYNQWGHLDGQVRKGEKGLHLVKWSSVPDRTKDDGSMRMIPNGFVVFNIAQVDGLPDAPLDGPDPLVVIDEFAPEAMCAMLDAVPAQRAAGKPSYSPSLDRVMMPPIEAFVSPLAYYATLAHELVHWTGHSSRLDRELSSRFGSNAYAVEELIAELGAAFTCHSYGVDVADRPDHAQYLSSWCSVLRETPSVLWTVASKAQAALDHIEAYSTVAAVAA